MSLKTLPADARPREKPLARGAAALSYTQSPALLLHTGARDKCVPQMADEVLGAFGGVAGLLHAARCRRPKKAFPE